MSGKEAKEQISQNLEIKRLEWKIRDLEARVLKPCGTCERLRRHDCGVFFECPFLGIVNPDLDGCTKHT